MRDFEGKPGVALVLGGSGGLGAPIAAMLADRGGTVVSTYRNNPVPGGIQLDLTDAEACKAAIEGLDLHTFVYAAGPHVPMRHLSRVSPADLAAQLSADTSAFFNAVHPALASLRRNQGSIVAVTTAATSRFPVRDGLSSAPKAGVEALVRGLAAEEGRYGVRVNAVGPGMLTDGMAERLISSGELDERALEVTRGNIPLRRFGTAEDIAHAVSFLASDRAGFVTGQVLRVDGGYTA